MSTEYKAVSTIEEYMLKLAGSKYVESDISSIYDAIEENLKVGKRILVIGCPC